MATKKTVTIEMDATDVKKLANAGKALSELAGAYIQASDAKPRAQARSPRSRSR